MQGCLQDTQQQIDRAQTCDTYPWQPGRGEVHESDELELCPGIAFAPHIDQHECEGGAQEGDTNNGRGEQHEDGAEHDHKQKVLRFAGKGLLLQPPGIPREEEHMEEEVEAEGGAEEEEVGQQTPELVLRENEMDIEVEGVRGDQLHVTSQRRQQTEGQIRSSDHRNIKVHSRYVHHDMMLLGVAVIPNEIE